MTTRQLLFDRPVPDGWRVLKVDQLKADEPSSCAAGPFGSNISSKYFVERGIPVIRGSNLRDDLTRFVPEGFVFVSEERATAYKGQHVRAGDLVFTCWGTLGQVGLIPRNGPFPEYIISNKQLKLRPNKRLANSLYLFYYFACPEMVKHILSIAIGAAVPGINLGILKNLDVTLPPLPVQRQIVAVLSAYDDLIQNNVRRIAILEEMAQAIYREWFVNFRFPGHETVTLINSPLGKIPEGWKGILFGDLLDSMKGGDWGEEQPTDIENEGVVVVRGTDFDEVAYGGSLRVPLRYISTSSVASRQLRVGDVIVENSVNAKSRCIGTPLLVDRRVLARLEQPAIAASFCKVFRFHDPSLAPVAYWHMRELRRTKRMEYYQNTAANGIGNFQAQKFAKEESLLLPVESVHRSALIAPLSDACDAVSNLASRIANLRKTRDLLLPKLLSGQLDVEELDLETGASLVEAET